MAISNKYEITSMYITNEWSRPDVGGGSADKREFGVAHEVGNPGVGVDAHYSFYNRKEYWASVHAFVDDKKIGLFVPFDETVHGVRYNLTTDNNIFGEDANDNAIHVELCSGGDIDFAQAYDRYVWLWAYICKKYGWNDVNDRLIGHYRLDPSRRTDPMNAFEPNGITWNEFINDVQHYVNNWDGGTVAIGNGAVHTIVSGDTLWGLSRLYDISVSALKNLNPDVDPQALQIGDTLRISAKSPKTHTIVSGDTLWDLANKYDVSVNAIEKLNPHVDPKALQIGDKLLIPNDDVEAVQKQVKTLSDMLPRVTLQRGDTGEQVKILQRALNAVYFKVGKVDGSFGPATEDAVIRFQSMYSSLDDDGIYGENTRAKLRDKLLSYGK